MIAIIRRLIVIAILFAVFLFAQTIQIESLAVINPKTLAVLGFLILASFALGEVFALLKLPRVIGYLIIGIIFGPYSNYIFNSNLLKVFNLQVIDDLSLVNNVTLGLIALTAGLELKIANIKSSIKSISLILLFKTVIIFLIITTSVFLLSPFIPFLADANNQIILSAGLILSVIALGTSIELTLVVANESKAKGRFIDLILSTAIVKDILVILLLAVVLALSSSMIAPAGAQTSEVFLDLGKELLFSIIAGSALGGIGILYTRYVHKEMLLFLIAFVVFGSEIAVSLHLEMLVTFVVAGFIIQNYSKYGENFHHPLQKLSLPVFITFFTVVGASLNLISVQQAFFIGLAIVVLRAIALFASVKLAAKISGEPKEFVSYGWVGFLSIGGLMLGLAIIISQKLPGLGADLKNLITSIVAFNIFLGPILLKIGIGKAKDIVQQETPEEPVQKDAEQKSKAINEIKDKVKSRFKEPDLHDEQLNKSLYNILFKVNDSLTKFDRKFIQSRGEESIELVVNLTEKYSDEYQKLRNYLVQPGLNPAEIRLRIFEVRKNLAEWLIALCEERKKTEKHILNLEPLIRDLFYSFIDLTDGITNEILVDYELEKLVINESDGFFAKLNKNYLKTKISINKLLNKNYVLKRKVKYRSLAKYFLVGEASQEILEAVNLVGVERLTTLKILRTFYNQMNSDMEQFADFILLEKDNLAFSMLLLEKLDEIHKQIINSITVYTKEINSTTEEIGTRLYYAFANPFNKLVESLHKSGTYELKEKNFRFSKVFEKSETAKEISLQSIRYWTIYYNGLLGLFQKEAHIYKMKVKINELLTTSLVEVSEEINRDLRETNNTLKAELNNFQKELDKIDTLSNKEIKILFEDEKQSHFLKCINRQLKILDGVKQSHRINILFENLIHRFSQIINSLPEKIELLEERDLQFNDRIPRLLYLKSVPIKSAAASILQKQLPSEIGDINELLINQFRLITEETKNFSLIINFHFDAAIKELSNATSGRAAAIDLAKLFNEKMSFRINEVDNLIDRIEKDIYSRLTKKVDDAVSTINEVILKRSSQDLNLYMAKEQQKSKLYGMYKSEVDNILHAYKKYTLLTKRYYKKYFKDIIHDLLIKYGLKSTDKFETPSESFLLNKKRLGKLPFIYKKLFDGTPTETSDFFIGLDQVSKEMENIIARYKDANRSSVNIVGEPGSGKTSLLNNIIVNHLREFQYVRYEFSNTITSTNQLLVIICNELNLERVLTLDELIYYLNDKSAKRVLLFENINKLFIKKVGGYEAINSFKQLISSTQQNNLWICTSGMYSWEFLKNSFEFESIFEKIFSVNELHKREIRTILLKRHNATGYGLTFVPDELTQFKSKFIKSKSREEEQRQLEEKYFSKLHEFSEGNVVAAMFYWLSSIEGIKNNKIIIKMPRRIVSRTLEILDPVYLLTLYNILLHGSLSYRQLSELFHFSIEKSREILDHLCAQNLIDKDEIRIEDSYFSINRFFYRLIEKELTKRNIK